MNHFIVKTQERVGEFEFISTSFIKGEFDKDRALEVANENAKFSHTEDGGEPNEDGFFSEGGQIHTKVMGVRLISEAAYNEMTSLRDYEKPTTWKNTPASDIQPAMRWDVESTEVDPLPNEPRYRIESEPIVGGQTSISIVPDVPADHPAFFNLPQLHVGVEISGGLPVVHIHSSNDELALSVFGAPKGALYGRMGDDAENVEFKPNDFLPSIVDVAAQLDEIQNQQEIPSERG